MKDEWTKHETKLSYKKCELIDHMFIFFDIAECLYIFSSQRGKFLGKTPKPSSDGLIRVGFVDGRSAKDFSVSPLTTKNQKAFKVTIKTQQGDWLDHSLSDRTSWNANEALLYNKYNGGWNQKFEISLGADGKFYITCRDKCLGWSISRNRIEFNSCEKSKYKAFDIFQEIKGLVEPLHYVQNVMLIGKDGIKEALKKKQKTNLAQTSLKELLGLSKQHKKHHGSHHGKHHGKKNEINIEGLAIGGGKTIVLSDGDKDEKTSDDYILKLQAPQDDTVGMDSQKEVIVITDADKQSSNSTNLNQSIKQMIRDELAHAG